MKEKLSKAIKLPVVGGVMAALVLLGGASYVYAESFPGGEDNGKTSRLKQASDDLVTLGHGSTSNDPDWGADWNRIITAGQWAAPGSIDPSDVRTGETFYNDSRTEQTGTAAFAGPCPTQGWDDYSGNANQTDNCVSPWEVASPAVAGDDKQDPTTGLVWSKCIINTAGVNDFSPNTSCTAYSWNNSHANNTARTAIELCSDRGNGWRLPTQKELMMAYIDGSYFNLLAPSATHHWSATETSSTSTWAVYLSSGGSSIASKSGSSQVRCVR